MMIGGSVNQTFNLKQLKNNFSNNIRKLLTVSIVILCNKRLIINLAERQTSGFRQKYNTRLNIEISQQSKRLKSQTLF